MSRRSVVGFDRRIDLDWLDAAAAQVATDAFTADVREYLWRLLDGVVSGDTSSSARGKTITVLLHIWADIPDQTLGLRHRTLTLLPDLTPDQRLAAHWAMMLATYPIFTDVATSIGRLIAIQGELSLSQLSRRMSGVWGERSTVLRAVRRIVRSMVEWGVLCDTDIKGIYSPAPRAIDLSSSLGTLLIEALLIDSEDASMPISQLMNHPALFPFTMTLSAGDLREAPQFRVHRQGLDMDIVELVDGGLK